MRLLILILTCTLVFACANDKSGIHFSIIDSSNNLIEISKKASKENISESLNTDRLKNFKRLFLEQYNGDKLIVEEKDEEGYLVLLLLGQEKFFIEKQPQTKEALQTILLYYLTEQDGLMAKENFY